MAALKTNGVTENNVKGVIKKQIENTAKRKGGAKTQMIQMTRLIRSILLKIWNYIVVIIFYSLILGHHEFIFSSAFEAAILSIFSRIKLSLKLSLKLVEFE